MKKTIFLGLLMLLAVPFTSHAALDLNLKYGMRGDSVVELQEFLTEQGVYSGPISGNFYSLTLAGVKAFQSKNGIMPISGYWGPLSRAKAQTLLDLSASDSDEKEATGTVTPDVIQTPVVQPTSLPPVTNIQPTTTPAPVVTPSLTITAQDPRASSVWYNVVSGNDDLKVTSVVLNPVVNSVTCANAKVGQKILSNVELNLIRGMVGNSMQVVSNGGCSAQPITFYLSGSNLIIPKGTQYGTLGIGFFPEDPDLETGATVGFSGTINVGSDSYSIPFSSTTI